MEQAANHIIGDDGCSFVEEVEMQALWRSEKAIEYPDDDRNQESFKALERLARWIKRNRRTPVVEALNETLGRLYERVDIMETFEPSISARLGRYGFGGPDDPEEWISDLTQEIKDYLAEEINDQPRRKEGRSGRGTAARAKGPLRLVRSRA